MSQDRTDEPIDPFAEPDADSASHFVAYVAAQPGTARAWRCKRCPGEWARWADITGPCRRLPAAEHQARLAEEA